MITFLFAILGWQRAGRVERKIDALSYRQRRPPLLRSLLLGFVLLWMLIGLMIYSVVKVIKMALLRKLPANQFEWAPEDVPEDIDPTKRAELLALFAQAKTEGRIFYGTYSSERAIVTCLTYSASSGQHVHFVDGENCGYTRAAMDLKNQMILHHREL